MNPQDLKIDKMLDRTGELNVSDADLDFLLGIATFRHQWS